MTSQNASLVLLWFACPPATVFVLVYGFFQPWFRSWSGRALFVSSTGLALLLNINLLFRLTDWALLAREGWVRNLVYVLITAGAYLMLAALTRALIVAARHRRNS